MHHTENIADGQPERSYQAVKLTMVKEKHMFRWGIIFLVIALIAAALGFGGLAGTAAGAAKLCLWWGSFCSGQPVYRA